MTLISREDFCCLTVSGHIRRLMIKVKRMMLRPMLVTPKFAVTRNRPSMISPRITAICPMIGTDDFVRKIRFKALTSGI